MASESKIPERLQKRYSRIRAGFITQGTTLNAWCHENGVKQPNAYKALTGRWDGPKARVLVERIIHASGTGTK